jgi:hypothetical protein
VSRVSVLLAAERFLEAAARRRKGRALGKLERPLERAVGAAFRLQGALLLDALEAREGAREAALPDWERAWDDAETSTLDVLAGPIEDAARVALLAGGKACLAEVEAELSWSLRNPRAAAHLERYGARRVTAINATTRDELRALVARAAAEGWSPDETASEIRDRFRGFADPRPQLHIRSRAHLVAVAELAEAYEAGNRLVADEIEEGGTSLEMSWLTAGDANVSDGCRENQGAGWIPRDEVFPSGDDSPPRHPACRCTALYRRSPDG